MPESRSGQCVNDSQTLPDVTLNFIKYCDGRTGSVHVERAALHPHPHSIPVSFILLLLFVVVVVVFVCADGSIIVSASLVIFGRGVGVVWLFGCFPPLTYPNVEAHRTRAAKTGRSFRHHILHIHSDPLH